MRITSFLLFLAFRDMALKDKYLKRWSLLPRYNIHVLESLKQDFVAGCTLLQSSLFLCGKGRVLDFARFCEGKNTWNRNWIFSHRQHRQSLRINQLHINLWIVFMVSLQSVPRPLSAFYLFTFFVAQTKVDSEVLGKQLLCGNQVFISSLFNRWEAG